MPYVMNQDQSVDHGRPFRGELPKYPGMAFSLMRTVFPGDKHAFANNIPTPTLMLFESGQDKYFEVNADQCRYALDALGIYAGKTYPDGFVIFNLYDTTNKSLFRIPGRMVDYDNDLIQWAFMENQGCIRIIQVNLDNSSFEFHAQYDIDESFFDVLYKVYSVKGRGGNQKKTHDQFDALRSFSLQQIWDASMQWVWDSQEKAHVRIR